jgi:light-regulated signal transduction histidine kinase (bacteriophytochrome)
VEYQIRNSLTGKTQVIHVLGQTVFDKNGRATHMLGTTQDVTTNREIQLALENEVHVRTLELASTNEELQAANEELSTTNEELSESTHQLMRTNEELKQFAYAASHDLQEPLRKIQTFSDRLVRVQGQSPQSADLASKIDQSAGRMSLLIKSLLEFSSLIKPEETFNLVDLNKIIVDIRKDFEHAIEEKNAKLDVSPMPVISGSELQMNQLFGNLLSNALKFISDREPRIAMHASVISFDELRSHVSNPKYAPHYHQIKVSDNGIGFEKQYADHIFEIFKRLHGRNEYKGSGIGLALCKRIVTNHNGYIYADSTPGQGSTFYIFFPKQG